MQTRKEERSSSSWTIGVRLGVTKGDSPDDMGEAGDAARAIKLKERRQEFTSIAVPIGHSHREIIDCFQRAICVHGAL